MKEPNVNTSATTGVTPGVLLKAARQEKGLSVDDVAARLCLSVQFVEDIERDDYSQMSARAYARGYVLSYAHLLGIPESQILPALTNTRMEFAPSKEALLIDDERVVPVYQSVDASHQRSSFMLWGSLLVLIILIGLAVMWWRGSAMTDVTGDNTVSTAVSIQPEGTATSTSTPTAPAPTSSSTSATTPPANAPTSASAPMSMPPLAPSMRPDVVPAPSIPARSGAAAPSSMGSDQNVMQPTELGNDNDASVATSAVKLPPPRSSSNR